MCAEVATREGIVKRLLNRLGIDKYISAGTLKNLSTLFTGTFISTIIPILFAPVMTRIFTTSDYGILGLYMSICGLLGVIAYAHYVQAIMLPKEVEEARQVMWLSIFFCAGISALSLVVIHSLYWFTSVINNSGMRFWVLLIPVSVFLNGVNQSLITWANRHQRYKTLASNRVIQAILTVGVQIVVGLIIRNESGLMLGLLTGQVMSVILLLISFRKAASIPIGVPQPETFKRIAVHYKNLLLYSTPSEFINNLINQTPIFLLQKFGGLSYVGSYNFTQRFLGLPQIFFSSAIVEVFKQKASYSYSEVGNCKEIFLKTFKVLTAIAILPFLLIVLFAPSLFAFVFGAQWKDAGIFAQFLSILFFFRFIVSPLTYVYIVAGKLKEDFWLHILFLVMTTLSFYVGNQFVDDKKYLILIYSITYSSVYIIYFFRSLKFSKGR